VRNGLWGKPTSTSPTALVAVGFRASDFKQPQPGVGTSRYRPGAAKPWAGLFKASSSRVV
jgi:hypothetical protein